MSTRAARDSGTSNLVATLLLVAIVMVLALLVLPLLQLPVLAWSDPGPPAVFRIVGVSHSDRPEGAAPNYDSRIVLVHAGDTPFENDLLAAEIYVGGRLQNCRIITLNGHLFITTVHLGVQTLSGMGCQTNLWRPGEKIALDLSDGTIHPGDRVRVDIIYTPDNAVISRDSCIA
ncbi:MAG: type IV pilin [Methanomicrobiaceae archaeon]|nr:type IV pilin [Methanomicrobiaceae archaeon]